MRLQGRQPGLEVEGIRKDETHIVKKTNLIPATTVRTPCLPPYDLQGDWRPEQLIMRMSRMIRGGTQLRNVRTEHGLQHDCVSEPQRHLHTPSYVPRATRLR